MLLAPKAGGTSAGFLAGWVVGIVGRDRPSSCCWPDLDIGSGGDPSTAVVWMKLVLGVLLLLLAARQWRGPARTGAEPALPKWMSAIDSFTAAKAAGLGLALSAVNPKNLLMCVAAGTTIAGGGLSGAAGRRRRWRSSPCIAASHGRGAGGRLRGRPRSGWPARWTSLQGWLRRTTRAVMATLLLVIGVVLIGKGLGGLGCRMRAQLAGLRLAAGLPAGVAARRRRRRPDGVGGAGPGVAGVRDDRRRPAGGRPVRRRAVAGAVRRCSAARGTWSWRPCRRPRRCRPAIVGDLAAARRATRLRRPHRGARAGHRPARRSVAGLARLGFLASFISEPVLKGFIVGLALTIIVGQLPKLFGVQKGDGRLLRAAVARWSPTSATPSGATLAVGVAQPRCWCSCLRRWLPLVPGSLVAVLLGIAAVALLDLDAAGRGDRRPDRRRPAPARPAGRRRPTDYLTLVGAGGRRAARRLRRGPGRGQDLRGPGRLRHRPQPGAARPRRGQPRRRAGLRHGGQRQPVQDRGQRRRRREDASSRPDGGRADRASRCCS